MVLSIIIIDNTEAKRGRVSKPRRVGRACVERSKEPIREGAAQNLENAMHHLFISDQTPRTTKPRLLIDAQPRISKEDHSLFAVTAFSFVGLQYVHCTASCYGQRLTEAPGRIKQEAVIADDATYSPNKFLNSAVQSTLISKHAFATLAQSCSLLSGRSDVTRCCTQRPINCAKVLY